MIKLDQNFEITTDKVKELFSNTADISILLNRAGVINDVFVNKQFSIASNTRTWLNKNIKDFLTLESIEKVERFLNQAWTREGSPGRPIELNHADETNWEFPVAYSYTVINDTSVLLSGRDLKSTACLLYTSPSPRDLSTSRMPSSA